MKQYTEILQIRISKEMFNQLSILEQKYHKKKCNFVKNAIIEKLKKDIPKLRLQKKAEKIKLPF